jgi:3-methylcrotonyl-CoA carboxylase alpha subunit
MIAKLIAHGPSRQWAIDELIGALEAVEVWPVRTNAAFLACAAADPDFLAGEVDTGFIPAKLETLVPDPAPSDAAWNLAAMAMLAADFGPADEEEGPWAALPGFRSNAPAAARISLRHGNTTRTIDAGGELPLEGVATAEAGAVLVFADGQAFAFNLPGIGGAGGGGDALDGDVESPMPGRVIAVEVAAGAEVTRGQKLLTLEAMKMEHSLTAPFDGMVTELNVGEGAQVTEGTLLVRIEKKSED